MPRSHQASNSLWAAAQQARQQLRQHLRRTLGTEPAQNSGDQQHAPATWRPLELTEHFRLLNQSGTIDWASIPTDALLVVDHPPPTHHATGQMGPAGTQSAASGLAAPSASPIKQAQAAGRVGTNTAALSKRGYSHSSAATVQPLQDASAGSSQNVSSSSPEADLQQLAVRSRSLAAVGPHQQILVESHQRQLLARPMPADSDGPLGPLLDAVNAYQAMGYDCPLFARKFGEEAAPAVEAVLGTILQEPKSPSPL